jgi:hypothetical protein
MHLAVLFPMIPQGSSVRIDRSWTIRTACGPQSSGGTMGKATTLKTEKVGSKELRVVRQDSAFYGLIDGKIALKGDDPDRLMLSLYEEVNKHDQKYFGFEGARNRFLHWFKGGFSSPEFVKDERAYKWSAKEKLEKHAPLDAALTGTGYAAGMFSVFTCTNLLSQFELMRMKEALQSSSGDAFVRGAARFAMGETKAGLYEMQQALKPYEIAKWTAVTYLPFLWRPETHMFLKPEVTTDFALRVGHAFDREYDAQLDLPIYQSLLDLVTKTEKEIEDLRPRDRIDVQSFIWVIEKYKDNQEMPKA